MEIFMDFSTWVLPFLYYSSFYKIIFLLQRKIKYKFDRSWNKSVVVKITLQQSKLLPPLLYGSVRWTFW
jgi:hypothetical protein